MAKKVARECVKAKVSFKPKGEPRVTFQRKCKNVGKHGPKSPLAKKARSVFTKVGKACARGHKNKAWFFKKGGLSAQAKCVREKMRDAGFGK